MKTKRLTIWAGAALLSVSSMTVQAVPALFDYGFNIDGTVSVPTLGDPVPAAVDISAFNDLTGLGTITATITGAGAHTFDAFFDHEIDEAINTFFNEFGTVSGTAAVGQSWEIDEPGFDVPFGDIFDNFVDSTLDNTNAIPSGLDNDVSMAMGWDFSLALGETATITLSLGNIAGSGFFLAHTDFDTNESVILRSTLEISGDPGQVPEPAVLYLLGIGLVGMVASRRRMKK